MKCQLCKRKGERTGLIYFPKEDVVYIGVPEVISYIVCLECYLGWLSQYLGMTNIDIGEYLTWTLNLEEEFEK